MNAPSTNTAAARKKRDAERALLSTNSAWLKVYAAKDARKAAAFYDTSGSMLVPNSRILTGRKAITKFIAGAFALEKYEIKWRPNRAGVARSGELGYTSGTYTMRFTGSSGKRVSDKGKYLMVWKKQPDGEWKVLFDISNSDLPQLR